MKRLTPLVSLLAGTGMMLMISASQAGTASEAIAQAETDLVAAQQARAEWRLLDPATSGSAVPLGKLLKTAKAKLEAAKESEAMRIAQKISWAAHAGIVQSEVQKTPALSIFELLFFQKSRTLSGFFMPDSAVLPRLLVRDWSSKSIPGTIPE
tara:strand:+ start:36 stop:494 length:459 start_codon:yes stop_codon:yes gene_type:complete